MEHFARDAKYWTLNWNICNKPVHTLSQLFYSGLNEHLEFGGLFSVYL